MGRVKKISIFISSLLLVILISFMSYFYYWLNHPTIEKGTYIEYYVSHGATFTKITSDLSKKKVILRPKLFTLYSNFLKEFTHIKYGTYAFTDNDTPKSILNKLIQGHTISIKITLPEGLNIYQIAERFETIFPSTTTSQWMDSFSNQQFIQMMGLKDNVKNIEGFVFPQTYFFDPHPEPQFVIKSILIEFKKNVTQEMFDKAKTMGLTPIQFITLASIVERETGLKSERTLVAGVYWNRIKKGMELQADPTVIYGIWDKYKGYLTKKDLLTPTPYNTYTFKGLPIGPISNPGIESILATLNPAKTDALYFVATGHGGHVFTKTLREHNKAVRKYIQYLRNEKKQKKL